MPVYSLGSLSWWNLDCFFHNRAFMVSFKTGLHNSEKIKKGIGASISRARIISIYKNSKSHVWFENLIEKAASLYKAFDCPTNQPSDQQSCQSSHQVVSLRVIAGTSTISSPHRTHTHTKKTRLHYSVNAIFPYVSLFI